MTFTGRIDQLISIPAGALVVADANIGATSITVESVTWLDPTGGFITTAGAVREYASIDSEAGVIDLTSPLDAAALAGTHVMAFPQRVRKMALVKPDIPQPGNSIWAQIPHGLSGFLRADGLRASGEGERVEYADNNNGKVLVLDVIDKQPFIDPISIPPNAITETQISPGSITTPLLAANAVAASKIQAGAVHAEQIAAGSIGADHIVAGAIVSDKLSSDAIDGKVITGAVVRTSADNPRVELSAAGLQQFDADGNKIVDMGGAANIWRGSGEFENILIKDGLEMFGKGNNMSRGSEMKLATTTDGSPQGPSLTFMWPPLAGFTIGWFGISGATMDADYNNKCYGAHFLEEQRIYRGNNWYAWPVTDGVPEYKITHGYTRVYRSGSNLAVTCGNRASNGKVQIRVWNDSGMDSIGSTAPTEAMTGITLDADVYYIQRRLGRVIGQATRFCYGQLKKSGVLYEWEITLREYETSGASVSTVATQPIIPITGLDSSEELVGVTLGAADALGLLGSGSQRVFLVHTNRRNIVIKADGTGTRMFSMEWPAQDNSAVWSVFSTGSISAGAMGQLGTMFKDGSITKGNLYTPNIPAVHSNQWWVSYTWRSHTSKGWETKESVITNAAPVRGAALLVGVPSLPAPEAGVGQARDPNADVYGWKWYLASGATDPGRSSRYLQSQQPSGNPVVDSSIIMSSQPTLSGSNPPATTSFPTGAPASIASGAYDGDGPLILLRGNGEARIGPISWNQSDGLEITGPAQWGVIPVGSRLYGTIAPSAWSIPNNGVYYDLYTSGSITIPSGAVMAEISYEYMARNLTNADGYAKVRAVIDAVSTGTLVEVYNHNDADAVIPFHRKLSAWLDVRGKSGKSMYLVGSLSCGTNSGGALSIKRATMSISFFGMDEL